LSDEAFRLILTIFYDDKPKRDRDEADLVDM